MPRPNFLIIGAARSGTTALAYFLSQHPEVQFANPKEPHFLSFAGQSVDFQGPGDNDMMNSRAITSLPEYESLFQQSGSAKAIGEGSVSTLYYHDQSIPNIQEYCPDAKLVVLLRNPIDRAFSAYLYMVGRGYETESEFEKALDAEQQRIDNHWHHIWHVTKMGFYAQQLRHFYDAFGRDKICVYISEEFDADQSSVIQDLCHFLEIDPAFELNTDKEINRSGKPKSALVSSAINALARTAWIREPIKAIVPRGLRDTVRAWNLKRPVMPEHCRTRLENLYKEEIADLEKLIDRDLNIWKNK